EPALDVEEEVEQPARVELGIDLGHRVQEPRLVQVAPGLGLDHRRQAARVDELGCACDSRLAVAEIRAEPGVGHGHGRTTVTALCSTRNPAGRTSGFRTRTVSASGWKRSKSASATAVASASRRSYRRSFTSATRRATSR